MTDRTFTPDLTGSDETLEALLERLRSFSKRRPHPNGRGYPPDSEHFVTSRRPRGGAGGAEAPMPKDVPLPDLFAPT
ncbi:hypothetical protein LJR219_003149 [Phenylobacterium sp. LjRoot219]|uniref:hypothetical protein n=1 Tax=Phenylobacterium sp. LjRoot219 TaxID=3342283 RepID=UPI003ECECB47